MDTSGWYKRMNSTFSKLAAPETFKDFCLEHEPRLKVLYPFLTQEQIKGKLLKRWKRNKPSWKPGGTKKQPTKQKFPVARVIQRLRSKPQGPKTKTQVAEHNNIQGDLCNENKTTAQQWLRDDNQLSQEGKTYRGRSFSLPTRVPEIISQATPSIGKCILKNGKVAATNDGDVKRNAPRVSFAWKDHHEHFSPSAVTAYGHDITPSPQKVQSLIKDTSSPSKMHQKKNIVTRPRKSKSPVKKGPKTGKIHTPKTENNSSLQSPKFDIPEIKKSEEKRFCLFEDEWIVPEKPKSRGRQKKTARLPPACASSKTKKGKKKERMNEPLQTPGKHTQPSRKSKLQKIYTNICQDQNDKDLPDDEEITASGFFRHEPLPSKGDSQQNYTNKKYLRTNAVEKKLNVCDKKQITPKSNSSVNMISVESVIKSNPPKTPRFQNAVEKNVQVDENHVFSTGNLKPTDKTSPVFLELSCERIDFKTKNHQHANSSRSTSAGKMIGQRKSRLFQRAVEEVVEVPYKRKSPRVQKAVEKGSVSSKLTESGQRKSRFQKAAGRTVKNTGNKMNSQTSSEFVEKMSVPPALNSVFSAQESMSGHKIFVDTFMGDGVAQQKGYKVRKAQNKRCTESVCQSPPVEKRAKLLDHRQIASICKKEQLDATGASSRRNNEGFLHRKLHTEIEKESDDEVPLTLFTVPRFSVDASKKCSVHSDHSKDSDVPEPVAEVTNVLLRIIMQLKGITAASQDTGRATSSPTHSKAPEISDASSAQSPSIPDMQIKHDEPPLGSTFPSNRTIVQVHRDDNIEAKENVLCDLFEVPEPYNGLQPKRRRNIPSGAEHVNQTRHDAKAQYTMSEFV